VSWPFFFWDWLAFNPIQISILVYLTDNSATSDYNALQFSSRGSFVVEAVGDLIVKACRKHMLLTPLLLVAAFCCSLALAQEETAALNGQITDHDGLAVAGVKVQALNAGTNVSYLADTNETGFYNFPTLPARNV
jgi:hypothetical protein